MARRLMQEIEQFPRRLTIEDPPKMRMMDDGLRLRPEMLQIRKADAIDARRLSVGPTAPDEPAHVEQQGRVVGQERAYGAMVLAVEIGRIDVATRPRKRWKSDTGELET